MAKLDAYRHIANLFPEVSNMLVEEAIDDQLSNLDLYFQAYGSIFENTEQLKSFVNRIKERLDFLAKTTRDECHRNHTEYIGVTFLEIKNVTRKYIDELVQGKIKNYLKD